MKIIESSIRIVNPFEGKLSLEEMGKILVANIETGARISHRSEEDAGIDTNLFLRRVIVDRADWSVAEHASLSVEATMDRGSTHEWVRHRIAGYTQESTRFVNYDKKMPPSFIYPQVEGEKHVFCGWCFDSRS